MRFFWLLAAQVSLHAVHYHFHFASQLDAAAASHSLFSSKNAAEADNGLSVSAGADGAPEVSRLRRIADGAKKLAGGKAADAEEPGKRQKIFEKVRGLAGGNKRAAEQSVSAKAKVNVDEDSSSGSSSDSSAPSHRFAPRSDVAAALEALARAPQNFQQMGEYAS